MTRNVDRDDVKPETKVYFARCCACDWESEALDSPDELSDICEECKEFCDIETDYV